MIFCLSYKPNLIRFKKSGTQLDVLNVELPGIVQRLPQFHDQPLLLQEMLQMWSYPKTLNEAKIQMLTLIIYSFIQRPCSL